MTKIMMTMTMMKPTFRPQMTRWSSSSLPNISTSPTDSLNSFRSGPTPSRMYMRELLFTQYRNRSPRVSPNTSTTGTTQPEGSSIEGKCVSAIAFGITIRPPPDVSECVSVFSNMMGALATSIRDSARSGVKGRMEWQAGATIRDKSNGIGTTSASDATAAWRRTGTKRTGERTTGERTKGEGRRTKDGRVFAFRMRRTYHGPVF